MRYFLVYLIAVAIIAFAVTATAGALAQGSLVCETGTYGAIAAGC